MKLPPGCTRDELENRALAAYFRSGTKLGVRQDQPAGAAEIFEVEGKVYVTLGNINGLLACYRVRNDGKLKRLVRPPRELRKG